MNQSFGIIGFFVGVGLLVHGAWIYLQCAEANILQYLWWGCDSIISQSGFEMMVGLALCGGSIVALVATADVEKPPKNPPLYHP